MVLADINPKYAMRISRLTVDKLGVKLYDRASAVLAELVANSYDADATRVEIIAPMGTYLAERCAGKVNDRGYQIAVRDNGHGMTPDQVNAFYLEVGAERRNDPRRGDRSVRLGRKVMGRKGVGKLAPFGICERIELLTAGGDPTQGVGSNGQPANGYLAAHLILDRSDILKNTSENYVPTVGALDGKVLPNLGTSLTMTGFGYRMVPTIEDLSRQLAQRFGIQRDDWEIVLIDSLKDEQDENHSKVVGVFDIAKMPLTELRFDGTGVQDESGGMVESVQSGFVHQERFYPVKGWVAYARQPYRDDLMSGIRIYCRGKIAAQTAIFNRKAGFTGEHDVRSYLVGELHADWLDEDEDLIQTDRRDILWSHDLGQSFQEWGQSIVTRVGRAARQPMKQTAWQQFLQNSNLTEVVEQAFPSPAQKAIRSNTEAIAKMIAETMRGDELADPEIIKAVVNTSLLFGPHLTLDKTLQEAANEHSPLEAVINVLRTARVAELSSFGRIAENRVNVIATVEQKIDESHAESVYQALISDAPWLLDPQWAPITSNQSFATLRKRLQQFIHRKTGEVIDLGEFYDSGKRADFVLANHDDTLELMEIKQPHHSFEDEEMERLNRYVDLMESFLADPANAEFKNRYSKFHLTLVCDKEKLTGVHKRAFEGLMREGKLVRISWPTFLLRTKQMHQEFLNEAERQRRDSAKNFL